MKFTPPILPERFNTTSQPKIEDVTKTTITSDPIIFNHDINREEYEKNLRERQRKHFEEIRKNQDNHWQPCLHDQCPQCHGTGVKLDGSMCVHSISCSCPKCSPHC